MPIPPIIPLDGRGIWKSLTFKYLAIVHVRLELQPIDSVRFDCVAVKFDGVAVKRGKEWPYNGIVASSLFAYKNNLNRLLFTIVVVIANELSVLYSTNCSDSYYCSVYYCRSLLSTDSTYSTTVLVD
jgi:hypothetical protein